MSEEQPFAEENPFLKLDRLQFPKDKKSRKITLEAGKNQKKQKEDSFAVVFDPNLNEKETRAFFSAVAGVTPLGRTPKKAVRSRASFTPPLENPVLTDCGKMKTKQRTTNALSATVSSSLEEETASPSLSRREKSRQKSREAVQRVQENVSNDTRDKEDTEERSFFQAMRDVTPLTRKGREIPPEIPVMVQPVQEQEETNPLQDFMEGKLEFALAFTDEYVEGHVVGLDLLTVGKLQAGQFSPESHIDLHGLNAQQAFQALVGFFRASYLKGYRTLLVVPGRGRNSPNGMPVLKDKLQSWFTQEPFRRVILAFCTAKPADGGAGALYVLLRKFRKDHGKVYWDRKPADPDLL